MRNGSGNENCVHNDYPFPVFRLSRPVSAVFRYLSIMQGCVYLGNDESRFFIRHGIEHGTFEQVAHMLEEDSRGKKIE